MSPQWLRGASFTGYGVTLTVGLGIPIPILDEEIMEFVAVTDADIIAPWWTTATRTPTANRRSWRK